MADPVNVVNPGQSPTPPATNTPPNPGSPASPASSKPEDVKPAPGTGAPAAGAGDKPETTVPIAALHEERTKRQALDTKLAQLQTLFGDKFKIDEQGNIVPIRETPAAPASSQAPMTQEQFLKQLEKTWEEDPRKAVNMEVMMALNWYDSLNTTLETQKDVVRAKYPDFGTFEPEVNRHLKKLPMDQRGQTGAVELAYLVAKGSRADTMMQSEKDKAVADLIKRIQAGEQIQGITGGTISVPSSTSGPKPSSDQMAAANAMGMKIEDYMKHQKA